MTRGRDRMFKVREVIRALERIGFRRVRQVGSHAFYAHTDGRVTTVSIHLGEDVGRGLLHKILRDIEISPENFSEFL